VITGQGSAGFSSILYCLQGMGAIHLTSNDVSKHLRLCGRYFQMNKKRRTGHVASESSEGHEAR
jgi:hypothetical protein